MEYIEYKGDSYLKLQSEGNAARWIMPLAQYFIGDGKIGYDIGCHKTEWAYPNALCIDPSLPQNVLSGCDAMNLPSDAVDYIFSSHCLEHIKENWMNVIDYWLSKIKDGGMLFLYLPHSSQKYWLPENNRKHVHSFNGNEIKEYLQSLGYAPHLTPVDFNNSFAVICEKVKKKDKDIYDGVPMNIAISLNYLNAVISVGKQKGYEVIYEKTENGKFIIVDKKRV